MHNCSDTASAVVVVKIVAAYLSEKKDCCIRGGAYLNAIKFVQFVQLMPKVGRIMETKYHHL